jgi:hypothetical protein
VTGPDPEGVRAPDTPARPPPGGGGGGGALPLHRASSVAGDVEPSDAAVIMKLLRTMRFGIYVRIELSVIIGFIGAVE